MSDGDGRIDALLTLNAGSSSLKFRLLKSDSLEEVARGIVAGIGGPLRLTARKTGNPEETSEPSGEGHDAALAAALDWIDGHSTGWRLRVIAHRVVHGGSRFRAPTIATKDVVDALRELEPLAPLHQPHNLAGITAAHRLAPDAINVACFDTAFHATMPRLATEFALPDHIRNHGVRRFGFHGLSYEWITRNLRESRPDLTEKRVVAAHLGNGASLCAIDRGLSVDTTMGMTPLDGVPMGTRSGAIDPGTILFLQRALGLSTKEITTLLYEESGLKGLSDISNDVAILLDSLDPQAQFALDHFVYRVANYAAHMTAAMGGIDALVFTGGIGENATSVREAIVERLAFLGRFDVLVIPAEEERMMAIHASGVIDDTGVIEGHGAIG